MEFPWSLQLLWILAAQSYSPGERCVRVCWLQSATEGDTDDCSATAPNPEQMLYKRENVSSLQRNVPASLSKPGPQQLLTTWHGMGSEGLNFSHMETSLALSWALKSYQVNPPGQGKEWLQELYTQQAKASATGSIFTVLNVCYKSSCIAGRLYLLYLIIQLVLLCLSLPLLYKPLQSGSLFCHQGETHPSVPFKVTITSN